MKNHRDEMFGVLPPDTLMWCIHCERTYLHKDFRVLPDPMPMGDTDNFLQMCPYEDCDGDAVMDSKEWDWVRENRPEYPEVPVAGAEYPL
jgi:hypothetical protein